MKKKRLKRLTPPDISNKEFFEGYGIKNYKSVSNPSSSSSLKELEKVYNKLRSKASVRLKKLANSEYGRYTPFYSKYSKGFKSPKEYSKSIKIGKEGKPTRRYINILRKNINKAQEFLNNVTSYVKGATKWYQRVTDVLDEELDARSLKKLFDVYDTLKEGRGGSFNELYTKNGVSGTNIILQRLAKVFVENKKLTKDDVVDKMNDFLDNLYETRQTSYKEDEENERKEIEFEGSEEFFPR